MPRRCKHLLARGCPWHGWLPCGPQVLGCAPRGGSHASLRSVCCKNPEHCANALSVLCHRIVLVECLHTAPGARGLLVLPKCCDKQQEYATRRGSSPGNDETRGRGPQPSSPERPTHGEQGQVWATLFCTPQAAQAEFWNTTTSGSAAACRRKTPISHRKRITVNAWEPCRAAAPCNVLGLQGASCGPTCARWHRSSRRPRRPLRLRPRSQVGAILILNAKGLAP